MANWDVFHSERLETERNLPTSQVRAGLAQGVLKPDDLIRPAGATTPWTRIGDVPDLMKPAAQPPAKPRPKPKPETPPEREPPLYEGAPPTAFFLSEEDASAGEGFETFDAIILPDDEDDAAADAIILPDDDDDDETGAADAVIVADDDDEDDRVLHVAAPSPILNLSLPPSHSRETYGEFEVNPDDRAHGLDIDDDPPSAELVTWDDDLDDGFDPQDEDEAAAEFTLSRGSAETVEELDLAAMVDVAFQLVLFFLVTATTILYKSLEIPKPNPESNPAASAAQGRPKTLDDMKDVFILVEIDPSGAVKIDHEPVRSDLATLIETLRKARETTDRKAMLLSADFSTPHKSAVLAYDAANEIGLSIAIARPSPNPNAPAAKGD